MRAYLAATIPSEHIRHHPPNGSTLYTHQRTECVFLYVGEREAPECGAQNTLNRRQVMEKFLESHKLGKRHVPSW